MTIQALSYTGYQDSTSSSALVSKRFVTLTEYWEKYYEYPEITYEWNNGKLEEISVSDFSTFLTYEWFWELLKNYLRTKPIGQIVGLEMGFQLALPNKKDKVRRPDLGVVLNTNSVPLLPTDKSYQGTFDLCIEAISDSTKEDIERDTEDKHEEYAKAGVKEYYILDGHDRYSRFYRLGPGGIYQPILATNGIIKSTVLPGFQFRISDLQHCPSPVEMITDKVYKQFVLPDLSQEKQARQKAEQRADKAEQRARRLAEQLRALGIEPEDI